MQDQETEFEREIAPLMRDVASRAARLGIPMVAVFQLNDGPTEPERLEGADDSPLFASFSILPVDCSRKLVDTSKDYLDGSEPQELEPQE